MVGFTAFSERAGEEAAFRLMQEVERLTDASVREHGGMVESFTGDGAMAVFGAPAAYEDAPFRACRAALMLLERIAAAGDDFEKAFEFRPKIRVGLNTGLAVVGSVKDSEGGATVMGDVVNAAARLQALAEPGTVVLSEATQKLVEGLVDSAFVGERQLKGKREPLRVYKLTGIRPTVTRFAAAAARGLSPYVGRERELEILEHNLQASRNELRVVDVWSEPGMGKSRLLYEFRRRIGADRIVVLSGNCSPDGTGTPLLPFIEVVRGLFLIRAGESEKEVARKLESGLTAMRLNSLENFGLLMNLLGLAAPVRSLAGLDGLLIGLRTRDLLLELLATRSRIAPLALLIEDLHWADNSSQELLGKIIEAETTFCALLLLTRRSEHQPPCISSPRVTSLLLEPLPAGDMRQLIGGRLGVANLPDALARAVTDRAEGNALFGEEIATFLAERGVVHVSSGTIDFDAAAAAEALPSSVQSLLTARVDRLTPERRALLQAASVIGRRFDPEILGVASASKIDIREALAQMEAFDLVRALGSGEFEFKHALLRDVLYQTLLTKPRAALHLRVAEEIERRNDNRLAEVAETLAYHYGHTDLANKAFVYLAMAGGRSLGLYAFDEADRHFAGAIALLDRDPECASDDQVAKLLVDFTCFSNLAHRLRQIIDTVERFATRIDRMGDDPTVVQIYHHYVLALLWSGRYKDSQKAQKSLSKMAARLLDARSSAYALASDIHISTLSAPYTKSTFEELRREAIRATSQVEDAYLQYFVRFVIAWEEMHRGRMLEADALAEEGLAIGQRTKDPRSTGFGLSLKSWIALISEDYEAALFLAESALQVSCTPADRITSEHGTIALRLLLNRPGALETCQQYLERCAKNGWHWRTLTLDGLMGLSKIVRGEIRSGLKIIEQVIAQRESMPIRLTHTPARSSGY
jgi:class 3 adenylate cyclase